MYYDEKHPELGYTALHSYGGFAIMYNDYTLTTYTTDDNKIKLSDGREFFETPINKVAEPIVQVYFKDWSSESGTVTSPTKITANFNAG